MRLLLDECVPRKIKLLFAIEGLTCDTVQGVGWSGKENGELLALAEQNYDVLVTTDKNIRYQQNLAGRRISVLVMRSVSNDYVDVRDHVPAAVEALKSMRPGQIVEVGISS